MKRQMKERQLLVETEGDRELERWRKLEGRPLGGTGVKVEEKWDNVKPAVAAYSKTICQTN